MVSYMKQGSHVCSNTHPLQDTDPETTAPHPPTTRTLASIHAHTCTHTHYHPGQCCTHHHCHDHFSAVSNSSNLPSLSPPGPAGCPLPTPYWIKERARPREAVGEETCPRPLSRAWPTAQWSVEDEEEATHDPCRQERDRQLQAQDVDGGSHVPERPEHEMLLSLKPSEAPELDEDEGFGDWSQRPEQRQEHEGVQGASDSREPPRCRSPEGEQEDKPGLHAGEKEDGDEVHLEELSLSKEEPDPEDTVQDNLGAAGAEEEQEEHQKCQQPRTPSPLILEGTIEHSSPPLSPTTKLIDRTESLNRSIEKSNSVKKSQPDLPISKIDQRLEQYTQAIETAGRTPKLARQASIELPSMAVASTKTPSCKDIVAGDMSKKSLWEQKAGSKTSSTIKSTPSGKRYKFVATGHGKYEKVLVEGGPAP
uniref:Lymphocyte specific protein 1 n=1 Tax=Papio anubis TaxID=9555 RepID=A0A8I5NFK4_PAPAN